MYVIGRSEVAYRNRPPDESDPDELSEMASKSGGEILTAAAWHGKQIALSADSEAKLKSQETLARLYQTISWKQTSGNRASFPHCEERASGTKAF